MAARLADVLAIPPEERDAFVRLARATPHPPRASTPRAPLPVPESADLVGRTLKGYILRERLGAGGFGVVYRAVQPEVGRDVAVKVILPQYADHPEFVRRFEAEAQLIARLEHPYIVPLYDYWRESGGAYLVMRYLRGGSLQTLLAGGPLTCKTLFPLLEQLGAALTAAHRAGVVHRDLKPANILLDEEHNAYLTDFGIATDLGGHDPAATTLPGALVGTPDYLAPEQILDEPITPRTDVYGLGVLLYELLTGEKPFRDSSPAERRRFCMRSTLKYRPQSTRSFKRPPQRRHMSATLTS
jgi:serine/threonine protein kinase